MRKTLIAMTLAVVVCAAIVAVSIGSVSRVVERVHATLEPVEANVLEAASGSYVVKGRDTVGIIDRIAGARNVALRPDSLMFYLGRLREQRAEGGSSADSLVAVSDAGLDWRKPLSFEIVSRSAIPPAAPQVGWIFLRAPGRSDTSQAVRFRLYVREKEVNTRPPREEPRR